MIVVGPGLSDLRRIENALVSVQPTVGAPHETVERFVSVRKSKPIKEHDWFCVWRVVAIAVGNEQQFRSRTDPDSAVTNFHAADKIQSFDERCARFESAIMVVVGEDQDSIEAFARRTLLRIRVSSNAHSRPVASKVNAIG